jgi:hypothetical protein
VYPRNQQKHKDNFKVLNLINTKLLKRLLTFQTSVNRNFAFEQNVSSTHSNKGLHPHAVMRTFIHLQSKEGLDPYATTRAFPH